MPATSCFAIAAGATNASELGRQLSVSKQAAAKTIALLEKRGYVSRAAAPGSRRKRLHVTDLGYEVLVEPDAGARAEYDDELYAAEEADKLQMLSK